ncbi:hypothetical protein ABPG74_004301 [Tetrahymena malaccensis]
MNFFGFNSNQNQRQSSNQNSNSNNNGQSSFFGDAFNVFFQSPFFNPPYQSQSQQQQQQQQQNFQSNQNNSQQHNPPRQSSQQYQQSQNRPAYPRFGSQSQQNNQQQSYQQQQQQNFSRSSQNNGRSQQQSQQEPRPTFQNTRSNWKKAEEIKKDKKKEVQKENTSDYWKQKGNEMFKQRYYDTALEYYTRAININPSQSIYYSNRGRCYKIKGDLKKAFEDAVQSIELDENNLKGQLLCGQVLCEMGKYEEGIHKIENGIKRLTKGLTLCSTQAGGKKKVFEKEISVYIFRAKKLKWYKQYQEQKQKKIRLIENYKVYLEQQSQLSDLQRQEQMDDFIFTVGDPYREDEFIIPDHLCCKITLDLIEDPVTTEAGHTYEKVVIEDHFKKNGYIDPFTRASIRPNLYPNHAIKQGVEEFLQANPWAFEYQYNDDFKKIEF